MMALDAIFLIFAIVDGIAFAVLANDYKYCFACISGAFVGCSVTTYFIFNTYSSKKHII